MPLAFELEGFTVLEDEEAGFCSVLGVLEGGGGAVGAEAIGLAGATPALFVAFELVDTELAFVAFPALPELDPVGVALVESSVLAFESAAFEDDSGTD